MFEVEIFLTGSLAHLDTFMTSYITVISRREPWRDLLSAAVYFRYSSKELRRSTESATMGCWQWYRSGRSADPSDNGVTDRYSHYMKPERGTADHTPPITTDSPIVGIRGCTIHPMIFDGSSTTLTAHCLPRAMAQDCWDSKTPADSLTRSRYWQIAIQHILQLECRLRAGCLDDLE